MADDFRALTLGQNRVLALYRIVIGLLFACHGAASLFGILGGAHGGGRVHFPAWPSFWAALIQLVCGVLVAVGLGTRFAALLASGSMAFAYFTVHQQNGLLPIQNGGELAALFCWAFFLIAVAGPGAWAIDRVITRARRRTAPLPEPRPEPVRTPVGSGARQR